MWRGGIAAIRAVQVRRRSACTRDFHKISQGPISDCVLFFLSTKFCVLQPRRIAFSFFSHPSLALLLSILGQLYLSRSLWFNREVLNSVRKARKRRVLYLCTAGCVVSGGIARQKLYRYHVQGASALNNSGIPDMRYSRQVLVSHTLFREVLTPNSPRFCSWVNCFGRSRLPAQCRLRPRLPSTTYPPSSFPTGYVLRRSQSRRLRRPVLQS